MMIAPILGVVFAGPNEHSREVSEEGSNTAEEGRNTVMEGI